MNNSEKNEKKIREKKIKKKNFQIFLPKIICNGHFEGGNYGE